MPRKNKPLSPLRTPRTDARFWAKVDRRSPSECWPWTAGRYRSGYGSFGINSGVGVRANRYAYLAHYGVDPGDSHVLHSCDNPICCNPHHLSLGTHQENMSDREAKGRNVVKFGVEHPHAKITETDATRIRQLSDFGMKQKDIATLFGICQATVSEIVRYEIWKHAA